MNYIWVRMCSVIVVMCLLDQNQAEKGGNEGWMEGLRREIVGKEEGLYGGFRGLGA